MIQPTDCLSSTLFSMLALLNHFSFHGNILIAILTRECIFITTSSNLPLEMPVLQVYSEFRADVIRR